MGPAPKILIVEDDWLIGDHLKVVIEKLGYAVCGLAASADDAVKLARAEQPAAILMDIRLLGPRDGIDAGIEINRYRPVPIIYVTGSYDCATRRRLEEQHPAAILQKPMEHEELRAALAGVCPLP
jgi:two-component system, response regulator PdtaR